MNYIMIPVFIILAVAWKLIHKTKWVDLSTADISKFKSWLLCGSVARLTVPQQRVVASGIRTRRRRRIVLSAFGQILSVK